MRLATVWLGGCSGCHMSLLDMDEFLIELAGKVELVYSPLMDAKQYPERVDVALVEGAVANADNLEVLLEVRKKTRTVVVLGDCAITGNVPAMRNPLGKPEQILHRIYVEQPAVQGQPPKGRGILPELLDRVLPIHEVVPVDRYLRGCPPAASDIQMLIEQALAEARAGCIGAVESLP